jgi:hypothetical protein
MRALAELVVALVDVGSKCGEWKRQVSNCIDLDLVQLLHLEPTHRVVAEGVGLRAEADVVKRDLEQQVASSRDATSACLAIACVTRHCTQNSHRE